MNVITIILSISASCLVAVIMFVWSEDSSDANKQPDEQLAQYEARGEKIKELEARLKQYEQSRSPQANGVTVRSPYEGNQFQVQGQVQKDIKDLQANVIAQRKLADNLNLTPTTPTDLANQEMTNTTLTGDSSSTPLTEENIVEATNPTLGVQENVTRSTQLKRINEIRTSKVQARIKHIDRSPDGDIILAVLEPNVFLSDGSILSIRRKTGIAGRIKIVSQQHHAGIGNVITIELAGSQKTNVQIGDELILPPRWDDPNS